MYNAYINNATRSSEMLLNDMHTDWDEKDNDVRPAIATLHTDGGGFWSRVAKAVRITELAVYYIDEESKYAELAVHFNTDDWRPNKHGLIYTDKLFMEELRAYFETLGIIPSGIDYSEQGMQGDNYVSCDMGGVSYTCFIAKFPEKIKHWE